jgi:hypothetical protein
VIGKHSQNSSADATVYYLAGTLGWRNASFYGLRSVMEVGYVITGETGQVYVVDACNDLFRPNPIWSTVATNLMTRDWSCFTDPDWRDQPFRFFRFRQP